MDKVAINGGSNYDCLKGDLLMDTCTLGVTMNSEHRILGDVWALSGYAFGFNHSTPPSHPGVGRAYRGQTLDLALKVGSRCSL